LDIWDTTAWYYDAITFCAAREIVNGIGNDQFGPKDTLTRGQLLVMVMRAYGIAPNDTPGVNFSYIHRLLYFT
jgi:hypothetical protein